MLLSLLVSVFLTIRWNIWKWTTYFPGYFPRYFPHVLEEFPVITLSIKNHSGGTQKTHLLSSYFQVSRLDTVWIRNVRATVTPFSQKIPNNYSKSEGFWHWCVIIRKLFLLDFVRRLNCMTTNLQRIPKAGFCFRLQQERGEIGQSLCIGPPDWASLRPGSM